MSTISTACKEVIKSLGIVFGDIGTSPLYTLGAAFMVLDPTLPNILGVLSLIVWTLTLIVTVQYAWLAMSLADEGEGEGGTIVLRQIILPRLRSAKAKALVTFLTIVGISFFIGDSVITPAVSILSAVEGLKRVPFLFGITQTSIIVITLIITIGLFMFQSRGTERVSRAFGPVMLVWFFFLGISGALLIVKFPIVLSALNPMYGIRFIAEHWAVSFVLVLVVLSKVILCATGAEALFVDMGHLGRKPIIRAWVIVFIALVLIYLGQGAFLHGFGAANREELFYAMMQSLWAPVYLGILVLSIFATVIASQASISGLFSLVYQAITTHLMPRLHVEYTSRELMSQIFIPSINKFLLIFVSLTILNFKTSQNLTSAYGLAVSFTMLITAVLLSIIFVLKRSILKSILACTLVGINALFFVANISKLSAGGYWPILAACFPLFLIIVYSAGRRTLNATMRHVPLEDFVERYNIVAPTIPHLRGTAIFLTKDIELIPAYVGQTMFANNIMYEENILLTLTTLKIPFGVTALFKKDLANGLRVFEVKVGYMEVLNLEKILYAADIHPKVIFYGVEDIATKNIVWKVFSLIKKLTPSFVQFYKLPAPKLHGVIMRVNM